MPAGWPPAAMRHDAAAPPRKAHLRWANASTPNHTPFRTPSDSGRQPHRLVRHPRQRSVTAAAAIGPASWRVSPPPQCGHPAAIPRRSLDHRQAASARERFNGASSTVTCSLPALALEQVADFFNGVNLETQQMSLSPYRFDLDSRETHQFHLRAVCTLGGRGRQELRRLLHAARGGGAGAWRTAALGSAS